MRTDIWQPMATVPNGRLVQLWMPSFDMFCAGAWRGSVSWCPREQQQIHVKLQTPLSMNGRQFWLDMECIRPLRWAELPPPPTELDREKGG